MKYSYTCNNCNYTVLSNSKLEIQIAREAHKPKAIRREDGTYFHLPKCLMAPTGRGTIARLGLAEMIKEGRA